MTTRIFALASSGVIVVLLLASLAFVWFSGRETAFDACTEGSVAGGQIGGPFELVRHDGTSVTDKDVIDGLTLIYFGYTFCPDFCPMDLARNAQAVELLEEAGLQVKPVFITVDPARDTAEVMADFTEFMHPRMVGLTGSDAQINAAKTAYGAYGAPASDEEDYLVDHTTYTYLMAPEHGFLDFFRSDVPSEVMAERVSCFAARV